MSVSRDDFSIAFRSALLQRGGAQKFSVLSLIFLAIIIGSFMNVRQENERLKRELEKYKFLELNVEFLTDENKNLQKILETEYFNKNLSNIILAKVLVDKNSPFLKSIIINKGTKAGILKGMPVTKDNYLVGRVVETNYLSSRVLLLNDLNSRIPVTLDEGAQAILSGSGVNNPVLEYLPEDYEIYEDINVFASGKDGIFTPGTPIGTTNEKGEVQLFVDPNQLSFVTVNLNIQNKGKM